MPRAATFTHPAEHQVLHRGRGAVAPRLGVEGQREPLPHPRPRPGGQLHGHQSRLFIRYPCLDERTVARPAGVGTGTLSGRRAATVREVRARRTLNVSLIRTARGRTIYVSHDTNLPRPYSRIHLVQGTKGLFQGYPDRVYIEGRSPEHRWEEAKTYLDQDRPSALVGPDEAGGGRGPRRHGLHRGLSPHQMPAGRSPDRHERLRRGGAERSRSAERAIKRAPQQCCRLS